MTKPCFFKKDAYVVCYVHKDEAHYYQVEKGAKNDPIGRYKKESIYDYKEVEEHIKKHLSHVDSTILVCKVVDLIKVDLKSLVEE